MCFIIYYGAFDNVLYKPAEVERGNEQLASVKRLVDEIKQAYSDRRDREAANAAKTAAADNVSSAEETFPAAAPVDHEHKGGEACN